VGTVRRRSKCPILIQLRSQFESGMTVGMELKMNSKLKRGSASSIACSNSRPFEKRIASSAQIDAAYKMNEAFCTLGITDLLHQTAMFEEYLLRLAMLFWKHVDKENRPMPVRCRGFGPCLNWTGCTDDDGYAEMKVQRKDRRGSHVAWFLATGFWPSYLCHACDNRLCVAVDHLWEGDQRSNMYDSGAKKMGGVLLEIPPRSFWFYRR
jgi:hypothetical protein